MQTSADACAWREDVAIDAGRRVEVDAAARQRFAVAVVSPLGYVHSQAFAEVATSTHQALLELGHDSIVSNRLDNRRRRHIVLGAHLLPRHPQTLPADAIVFNLEQVTPGSKWFTHAYLQILARHRVWDYSDENIAALRNLGITATHVPIGYAPGLARIERRPEDIDVLFYGSLNERRRSVLDQLRARGLRVEAAFGLYGRERDALIARSRVVLNMHFYESKVFEIVRVSYLLANGVCVVSETGADPALEAPFAAGIAFEPYERLADRCAALVADPTMRSQIALRGRQLFRRMPMAPGLAAAVARL